MGEAIGTDKAQPLIEGFSARGVRHKIDHMGKRTRLCRHVSAGPRLVDRPPGEIPRGIDFLPFPLQRLALADAKTKGKAGIIDAAQYAVGAKLHLTIAAQRPAITSSVVLSATP